MGMEFKRAVILSCLLTSHNSRRRSIFGLSLTHAHTRARKQTTAATNIYKPNTSNENSQQSRKGQKGRQQDGQPFIISDYDAPFDPEG